MNDKSLSNLIKPLLNAWYPTISHGTGVYLYDVEGKKYLDGSSGAVTANVGHGVQEIIDKMNDQAKKLRLSIALSLQVNLLKA